MDVKALNGNEALFQGALAAGANFFASYPISPATSILELAASYASTTPQFKFIKSEDEIAAIHHVIGASLAGARAFTATSNGGFTLMQEGIGYMFYAGIRGVIIDVQRLGDGTGMPTMPAQQNIMQCLYGSHGERWPLVFYPNSPQECYDFIIEAFRATEELRMPVFVLSDAVVGNLIERTTTSEQLPFTSDFQPLGIGGRCFTSLVVAEDGRPTQCAEAFRFHIFRMRNTTSLVSGRYRHYEFVEQVKHHTLLVGYGGVSRTLYALVDEYPLFRPITIFPLLDREIHQISQSFSRIIVVESNEGQYAYLLRKVVRIPVLSISVYSDECSNLDLIRKRLEKC